MPGNPKDDPGIRRPTMADVGRLAGVSATTVSFVINDSPGEVIRPTTRQRVLDAVDELGYRPNRAAQGLRTRRTSTIGFITDEVAVESFVGQIITGAHDVAWSHGSVLLVINTMRSRAVMRATLDNLADRQVDSIIFASASTRRVTLPPDEGRAPTVLVNCFAAGGAIPCVLPDEVGGGRNAVRILLDAGHTRIAYLTGVPGAWATRARLRGFREELRSAGIDPADQVVSVGNYQADSGYELTLELLAKPNRPTGILCGNDRMAVGALMALREKGVDVPAEMSLVGYDDHDQLVARVSPAITNVRLPFYEMGR
ncbi:MAG: LacI family DNA-binding transcriptional regulator, partial [Dermatophilaceae bacterium]